MQGDNYIGLAGGISIGTMMKSPLILDITCSTPQRLAHKDLQVVEDLEFQVFNLWNNNLKTKKHDKARYCIYTLLVKVNL